MQITINRVTVFFCLSAVAGALIFGGMMFGITKAEAQQGGMKVTGQLNNPASNSPLTMKFTRMEDSQTGVVCYVTDNGSFSCVKK